MRDGPPGHPVMPGTSRVPPAAGVPAAAQGLMDGREQVVVGGSVSAGCFRSHAPLSYLRLVLKINPQNCDMFLKSRKSEGPPPPPFSSFPLSQLSLLSLLLPPLR